MISTEQLSHAPDVGRKYERYQKEINYEKKEWKEPIFLSSEQLLILKEHQHNSSIKQLLTQLETQLKEPKPHRVHFKPEEEEEGDFQGDGHILVLKKENIQLRKRAESAEKISRCEICCQNYRNVVLMPCMHLLFCAQCISNLPKQKCPKCGENIQQKTVCITK
jgi:hypothetical protein